MDREVEVVDVVPEVCASVGVAWVVEVCSSAVLDVVDVNTVVVCPIVEVVDTVVGSTVLSCEDVVLVVTA